MCEHAPFHIFLKAVTVISLWFCCQSDIYKGILWFAIPWLLMRKASWILFLCVVAILILLFLNWPFLLFFQFLLGYFYFFNFFIVKLLIFIFHMFWKYFYNLSFVYWICLGHFSIQYINIYNIWAVICYYFYSFWVSY